MLYIAILLIGYLCGCFLTADVVMRVHTGTSAFAVGSGNPGMANVGAQLGTGWAVVVLAGDILKTIAAVAIAAAVCGAVAGSALDAAASAAAASFLQPVISDPWCWGFPHSGTLSTLLAGLGVVIGHDFPFWHGFRGGKGVTATCSAIILFSPLLGGAACLIGLALVAACRKLDWGALAIPTVLLIGALAVGLPSVVWLYAAVLLLLSAAVWVRGRRRS